MDAEVDAEVDPEVDAEVEMPGTGRLLSSTGVEVVYTTILSLENSGYSLASKLYESVMEVRPWVGLR